MKFSDTKSRSGETVDECISQFVWELEHDDIGVGLCTIVSTARRSFGFEGVALTEFVRRGVAALVEAGARPYHDGFCSEGHVEGDLHYGTDTPAEIVLSVVETWVREGMPDLKWGDFRFNHPENIVE